MTVLVRARDVRRDYPLERDAVHALRGVSLEIAKGEYLAIVGPSGCGKSSLLNLLGAIDAPTSGTVEIEGRNVGTLGDREVTEFRLKHIGFVFQRFYLLPILTARENVELPMAEAGVPPAERRRRSAELLRYVDLGDRVRHRPSQLSGGEQQRVGGGRAIGNRASIQKEDEPTGELDARTGQEIVSLFGRLNDDGTTVVVVTHDESLARAARRVVHMRDGEIVQDGVPHG